MWGRRGKDDSLSKGTLLELLRGGIRRGISKRLEDCEVQVNTNEQIAQIANVSIDIAIKIRDYIETEGDLDWSECTQGQFVKAIREAKREVVK